MDAKILAQTLALAEEISMPMQCLGNQIDASICDMSAMDRDPDTEKVCDICRVHWLIVSAKTAAERLVEDSQH